MPSGIPAYKGMVINKSNYKLSEDIYSKGISLPSSYGLSDEEQDYIVDNIIQFYE